MVNHFSHFFKLKWLLFRYVPTQGEIEELKKASEEESADVEGDKEMGEENSNEVAKLYGFDKYDDDEQPAGGRDKEFFHLFLNLFTSII